DVYKRQLQMRAGLNTPQAAQVQALIELLAVPKPAAGPQAPTKAPTPASRPTAAPAAGTDIGAILRGIAMVLLWLLFFAVAIVVAYKLWGRWRRAHQSQSAVLDVGTRTRRPAPAVQPPLTVRAEEPELTWSAEAPAAPETPETVETARQPDDTADQAPPVPRPGGISLARPPAGPPRPPVKPFTPAGTPRGAFTRVGEYTAIYQMDETAYDEAFDIVDAAGNYLGQCALTLQKPIGRNRDQAAALEATLWDSKDAYTRVKVLMSEGAYRDTALREQLRDNYEALLIRPGTEFELETHRLLLRGRVEKLEYADLEPAYTIFAELVVRFQVDWNGALD
ncbi:MAG: hypothetical protein N2439_08065, partial [Anaerolineae bacterium]|nr:hypothetical protein [Anaerolineae bacterium]